MDSPPLSCSSEQLGGAITVQEQTRLQELETIVARGMAAFVEVGMALAEIRDKQLYRGTHRRFKDYVAERFSFAERHAQRLIQGVEVYKNLIPGESTIRPAGRVADKGGSKFPAPTHESQVRDLAGLNPEEQRQAWEAAVEIAGGETPTAAQVREAVQAQQDGEEVQPQSNLPERLRPIFEEAAIWKTVVAQLRRTATALRALEESALWQRLDPDPDKKVYHTVLAAAAIVIEARTPAVPCPNCGGEYEPSLDNDPCPKCLDRTFLCREEVE